MQTLGTYSIITDDIKQGGPYMSLLQFDDDVMPFSFSDVLILRYLLGSVNAAQTIEDFNTINTPSEMNWSFYSHTKKFVKRFLKEPYRLQDKIWLQNLANEKDIKIISKLKELDRTLKNT